MLASYRSALELSGVPRVAAAVLVCYLLAGMVNLSLLQHHACHRQRHTAGAVVGAY